MKPAMPRALIDAWDRRAATASRRLRRPALTALMAAVSASGQGQVWFSLGGALFVWQVVDPGPPLAGFLAGMLAAGAALVVGQVLKRLIGRPRPYDSLVDHEPLGRKPHDTSMPSTHAATSVALATWLAATAHPLALIVVPWTALVVLSRYYLGVHYPSDLVAGSLLGAALALAIDWSRVVTSL